MQVAYDFSYYLLLLLQFELFISFLQSFLSLRLHLLVELRDHQLTLNFRNLGRIIVVQKLLSVKWVEHILIIGIDCLLSHEFLLRCVNLPAIPNSLRFAPLSLASIKLDLRNILWNNTGFLFLPIAILLRRFKLALVSELHPIIFEHPVLLFDGVSVRNVGCRPL